MPIWVRLTRAVSANAGGYSSISQHSSLRPDGISTSGDWSTYAATDEGVFSFGTLTDATFDVLYDARRLHLHLLPEGPQSPRLCAEVDLFLRPTDGGGADVFRVVPRYDPDLYTASGTHSGVLSPGRYQFQYFSSYLGDVGEFGRYHVPAHVFRPPRACFNWVRFAWRPGGAARGEGGSPGAGVGTVVESCNVPRGTLQLFEGYSSSTRTPKRPIRSSN